MRYMCVHCEHRWESAEPPMRCPACMRATGVEAIQGASEEQPGRRSPAMLIGIAALTLLAAGAAGYFIWSQPPSAGEEAGVGPLARADLHAALAKAQVDAGTLEALLGSDPNIERFAETAASAAGSAQQKADAITRAIRARASALAFVPWSLAEPRTTPVGTAKQTLSLLNKDRGRAELYPLEVAALAVSALRSLEVPAMVVELASVEGERAPLDPSGYLGYFAVAVFADAPGVGTPRLYDPYGGRTLAESAKFTVLSDPEAIGAALALRALHEVSYLADPQRALASSSHALTLAATLPSVRTVRGMVVLADGMVEQGLQEFAAARQLRSDPPRLHNLANAELMSGDVERAEKELQTALERAPDFASAHATLGSVALMRGEPEQAKAELARAEQLAPDLSLVQWAQAELLLRAGEREQALATARRALASRPSFDARLRMGVLLRQAGRYDELRETAQQLLAMAPASRKGDLRDVVQRVLGPASLDGAEAAEGDHRPTGPTEPAAPGAPPVPQLELGGGSMGASPAAPDLPPLQEPSAGASEPKLRLRDQGDQLRLKLK